MKARLLSGVLSALLLSLTLQGQGYLRPVQGLVVACSDALCAPMSASLVDSSGTMPRQRALRRVIRRTSDLLESEGHAVDEHSLRQIARIAERASLTYRLPPALILSVIHSESRFRPDAVSPAGAIGLMQIQPATAVHFADATGLPAPSFMSLFDPEVNIPLGAGYLRLLIDRFGDLRTALAAYHVGPTEIARRLAMGQPFSHRYGREIEVRHDFRPVAMTLGAPEARPIDG